MSSDFPTAPYASLPPGVSFSTDDDDGSPEWEPGQESTSASDPSFPASEADLGDTLLRLRDELADVLPQGLVLRDDPDLALHGEAALIDLLLIQLVLTVRDMAAPGQLDLQVAKEDPRWARITVRGNQPGTIGQEELEVLCQLAEELEGTVRSVPGGLSVLLPTGAAPRRVIAVGCGDPRVVETLEAEIVRCGARMVELRRGQAPPEGADLVLADDERLDELPPGDWRSIALVPRRPARAVSAPPLAARIPGDLVPPRTPASGDGSRERVPDLLVVPPRTPASAEGSRERVPWGTLGIPLVVGELEAVLAAGPRAR